MSKLTLIALAAIISATAQDRPLVFQVGAELVVLDVIATDAAGREVSDLTSAEVQITEDGSPRPVQQLQLISRKLTVRDGGIPAPLSPPTPAERPPEPAAAPDGVSLVIAIDLNSMSVDAMPRVTDAVLDVVRSGRPDIASTMIVTLSEQLQVIQPFTSDLELLRRTTGRIAAAAAVRTNMDPLFERLDRICNIAGPSDVVNMGVSVGQEIVTEGNRRMVYTTQASIRAG